MSRPRTTALDELAAMKPRTVSKFIQNDIATSYRVALDSESMIGTAGGIRTPAPRFRRQITLSAVAANLGPDRKCVQLSVAHCRCTAGDHRGVVRRSGASKAAMTIAKSSPRGLARGVLRSCH
jgi:hypothetical protein